MIKISYEPLEHTLQRRGISKGQLARGADLSKATLAKIGNNEPLSLEVLARIAIYLNESVGRLISITDKEDGDRTFAGLIVDPGNMDFRRDLLSALVHSAALLAGIRMTSKEIGSYLAGKLELTTSKEASVCLSTISKTIIGILDKPAETFDAMFVNEIFMRFGVSTDTGVDKNLWKKMSRFTFKWTAVSRLSPEEEASFVAEAAEIVDGTRNIYVISYILLIKLCLLSNSYAPLLSEELVAYYSEGISTYKAEATYLIAALESGIEQTKSLMKRHFIPLFH